MLLCKSRQNYFSSSLPVLFQPLPVPQLLAAPHSGLWMPKHQMASGEVHIEILISNFMAKLNGNKIGALSQFTVTYCNVNGVLHNHLQKIKLSFPNQFLEACLSVAIYNVWKNCMCPLLKPVYFLTISIVFSSLLCDFV